MLTKLDTNKRPTTLNKTMNYIRQLQKKGKVIQSNRVTHSDVFSDIEEFLEVNSRSHSFSSSKHINNLHRTPPSISTGKVI